MKGPRTVALIPARAGSKSIPGKNIVRLAGRPLLHFALDAAAHCPEIDAVYVASDSEAIRASARDFAHPKVVAIDRSAETATDTASTESILLEFAREHEFERLVLIQATSPLTTNQDITGALAKLHASGADSLVSVTHEHRFRWQEQSDGLVVPENYNPLQRPRRQDWPGELVENGAFYVCSREGLLKTGCRLHGRIAFWLMAPKTAFEIDTPADWEVLEALVSSRSSSQKVPRAALPEISLLITDVDGVLTDAGMYYGPAGDALKKFNTKDGMGANLWQKAGKELAIVTGESSEVVQKRADKLKIKHVHLGASDKLKVVEQLLAELNIPFSKVAYLGDDINDLEVMKRVGFAACPRDAVASVRALSHYVCGLGGGEGCFREVVDCLLGHRDA